MQQIVSLLMAAVTGAGQPSIPSPMPTPAAREVFAQRCAKCHGADGTGRLTRAALPDIPDFNVGSWQALRSDDELRKSILEGKGDDMPPFRGKIGDVQATDLVNHVRAFAPAAGKLPSENSQKKASPNGFDNEFARLQQEMEQLKKERRELPDKPAPPASPPRSAKEADRPKPAESAAPKIADKAPQTAAAADNSKASALADHAAADRELFRQHCAKCHGEDGTGNRVRRRQPEIPDFTDTARQVRRSNPQLLASVLDGMGTEMPAWRALIPEDRARRLISYTRKFARKQEPSDRISKSDYPGRDRAESRPEEPLPTEAVIANPPRCIFEKLIRWLGKYHPAAVHFPIALLAAAAIAEILRVATRRTSFDAVSRFCVWFGAVGAVGAGALGWFAAGTPSDDTSCAMATHRWLGTCTVAGAGLVLALSERARRPGRLCTRMWFRIVLLLVAASALVTGYFGGAIVFGLAHYGWPQ